MESAETITPIPKIEGEDDEEIALQMTHERCIELPQNLPRDKGWMTEHLVLYQGFWLTPNSALKAVISIQNRFSPRASDIFLASSPKTGTTWLKALIFATLNRTCYDFSTHPLLVHNPHDCVPLLDTFIHQNDLESCPSPRFLSTHMPFTLLPCSMTCASSGCKLVYVCRNPKDVLVSKWKFMNKLRPKHLPPLSLDEAFKLFCEGVSHYGPYWDHVLGYWKASLENPEKLLFLKYEDLKREPLEGVKRLAEFLGKPFLVEEEKAGMVQGIVRLCSFENLRNLEVNKRDVIRFSKDIVVENRNFFRKGKVGDSENYLTAEMMQLLDEITEKKFFSSGLIFGA
ncbi:hypothetical protein SLA2020_424690 [Shorea laevis]